MTWGKGIELNQKQYIIKGMLRGMGVPLVCNKILVSDELRALQ